MDLKDFVKESLVQIATGVKESQEAVRDVGGYTCPAVRLKSRGESHLSHLPDGRNIFLVDFDVALTVSESADLNAGAKLKVASVIDIGGGAETTSGSTATSRVTFKVPLALPADEQSIGELKERDDEKKRSQKQEHERVSAFNRNGL